MKKTILTAAVTVLTVAAMAQTPTNKVYMRKGVAYPVYACPNPDHHLYFEYWTTAKRNPPFGSRQPVRVRRNLTWVTWFIDRNKIKTI